MILAAAGLPTSMDNIEILQCKRRRRVGPLGWRFPLEVEELLRDLTAGQSVLHLFGGHATFGLCLDIDPLVRPDCVGDAWLPPFPAQSFDVVVLDPPYNGLNAAMRVGMFYTAAVLARQSVISFNTMWVFPGCKLEFTRAWLVICGRSSAVRCLQFFKRLPGPLTFPKHFTRGPALRYNRWLAQPQGLPFHE